MRLAKFISKCGIGSRRQAEQWIIEGRVSVNDTLVTSPATLVSNNDQVIVDERLVRLISQPHLWLYHKTRGFLCTREDPQGRPTIFDHLPFEQHIISIGRLDLNSEGLLLLTTHGEIARYCELPQTGWERCYQVRVYGDLSLAALERLKDGVTIKGIQYAPLKVNILSSGGRNTWLHVVLQEGKNREIRRIMEHIGLQVNRLKRLAYGPFQLGPLKPGEIREVPWEECAPYFPFISTH